MSLLRIARTPAVTVTASTSVQGAVDAMTEASAGAVVVTRNGFPSGIFTARDLVRRVMASRFPLDAVSVSEVMTSSPKVATDDMRPSEALAIMMENHVRHLPIVDHGGRVRGMLSTRHLLREMLVDLSRELDSLSAYIAADGIGG